MLPYSSFNRAHIELAHFWWGHFLQSGDIAVDATCGNGYDTVAIAQLLMPSLEGFLFAMDVQKAAIDATKKRVEEVLGLKAAESIAFFHQCHSTFPSDLKPATVKLILYNLGYLPGGDKTLTTRQNSTLVSLAAALPLIAQGGAISVTCYPGHVAGLEEFAAIRDWAVQLPPAEWGCCCHQWLNRPNSPVWLLLYKTRVIG